MRVVERRRAPRIERAIARACASAIRRERRDDIGVVADRDDHRAIVRLQLAQERLRRELGQSQRFAGHAEAAIDAERDGQRKLAGGKGRDLLRRAVFEDLEIGLAEAGDRLALRVGDRGVDLDQLDTRGEGQPRPGKGPVLQLPRRMRSTIKRGANVRVMSDSG